MDSDGNSKQERLRWRGPAFTVLLNFRPENVNDETNRRTGHISGLREGDNISTETGHA